MSNDHKGYSDSNDVKNSEELEHSQDHDHESHGHDKKNENRKTKGPSENPENLSEQLVSGTLRGRESKCSANCGSDGCGSGGCGTGGCGVGSIVDLIVNQSIYSDDRRIVEVNCRGQRKEFVHIEDAEIPLRVRETIILQTERGLDAGVITMTGSLVHAKRKAKKLSGEEIPTLVRKATAEDIEKIERNRISEREALSVCRTRVESFDLPMELVDAEWQFDHNRVTFFFTADGRVDFRDLVRDLAAIFHTRIELRQIPVRDAAKRIGGMGVCGLELCCTTHLGRYEHITLDHAKIQQLPVNPAKLSGQCGRLKCCLLYEIDFYVEGLKRFPPLDSIVHTAQGEGVINKIDLFKDIIYIYHPETHGFESITLEEFQQQAALNRGKKEQRMTEDA